MFNMEKTQELKTVGLNMEPPTVYQKKMKKSNISKIVCAVMVTTMLVAVIVMSIYMISFLNNKKNDEVEDFTLMVKEADFEVPQRYHNDPAKEIISIEVMEKGNWDHSITFYDFVWHMLAMKDFSRQACYIMGYNETYQNATKIEKELKELNSTDLVGINMKEALSPPIHSEVLYYAAGPRISDFCADFPSYWLVDAPENTRIRRCTIKCSGCK